MKEYGHVLKSLGEEGNSLELLVQILVSDVFVEAVRLENTKELLLY